jgi:hypothetical protein
MTVISETDGRLPRVVPCAQVGPARSQLTVPLDGFPNPDRNPKTTMLATEPPAAVAALDRGWDSPRALRRAGSQAS